MPLINNEKIQHCLAEMQQAMGVTSLSCKNEKGEVRTQTALGQYFDEEQLLDAFADLCQTIIVENSYQNQDEQLYEKIKSDVETLLKNSSVFKESVLTQEAYAKIEAIGETLLLLIQQNDSYKKQAWPFIGCVDAILKTLKNTDQLGENNKECKVGKISVPTLHWFEYPVIEVPAKSLTPINQQVFAKLKTEEQDLNLQHFNACRDLSKYHFDQLSNATNATLTELGISESLTDLFESKKLLDDKINDMGSAITEELLVNNDAVKDFILYGHTAGYIKNLHELFVRKNVTNESLLTELNGHKDLQADVKAITKEKKYNPKMLSDLSLPTLANNADIYPKNNGLQHIISMSLPYFDINNRIITLSGNKPLGLIESTIEIQVPTASNDRNILLTSIKIYPFHPATINIINQNLCEDVAITDLQKSMHVKANNKNSQQEEIKRLRFAIKKSGSRKDILDFYELKEIAEIIHKLNLPDCQLSVQEKINILARYNHVIERTKKIANKNSNENLTQMAKLVRTDFEKLCQSCNVTITSSRNNLADYKKLKEVNDTLQRLDAENCQLDAIEKMNELSRHDLLMKEIKDMVLETTDKSNQQLGISTIANYETLYQACEVEMKSSAADFAKLQTIHNQLQRLNLQEITPLEKIGELSKYNWQITEIEKKDPTKLVTKKIDDLKSDIKELGKACEIKARRILLLGKHLPIIKKALAIESDNLEIILKRISDNYQSSKYHQEFLQQLNNFFDSNEDDNIACENLAKDFNKMIDNYKVNITWKDFFNFNIFNALKNNNQIDQLKKLTACLATTATANVTSTTQITKKLKSEEKPATEIEIEKIKEMVKDAQSFNENFIDHDNLNEENKSAGKSGVEATTLQTSKKFFQKNSDLFTWLKKKGVISEPKDISKSIPKSFENKYSPNHEAIRDKVSLPTKSI